jgi:hypothetical protein
VADVDDGTTARDERTEFGIDQRQQKNGSGTDEPGDETQGSGLLGGMQWPKQPARSDDGAQACVQQSELAAFAAQLTFTHPAPSYALVAGSTGTLAIPSELHDRVCSVWAQTAGESSHGQKKDQREVQSWTLARCAGGAIAGGRSALFHRQTDTAHPNA